jgi:hypothetical protein
MPNGGAQSETEAIIQSFAQPEPLVCRHVGYISRRVSASICPLPICDHRTPALGLAK